MRVYAASDLIERLTKYCASKLPEEACGFIIGDHSGETVSASDFVPVRNAAADRLTRFEMDPSQLIQALYRFPDRLIGTFHSHPNTPPIPSRHDRDSAWHTLPTYWIVSLSRSGNPEFAVYSKKDFASVREVFVSDG